MTDTKKNQNKKEEVVVNLDTLGVPIAIVLAGVIIASVIFFTNKNADNATDNKNDNKIADNTGDTTSGEAVALLGDDPYLGNKDTAKVALIDFSDYQCSYCQKYSKETFDKIKTNFIDTGKIVYVFKEFPLSSEGQVGFTTAQAAMCVFELSGSEVFSDFHKEAFFKETNAQIKELATSVGVDGSKYDKCMSEGRYTTEINNDREEGSNAGVTGTPGFVIGVLDADGNVKGKLIAGAYPYATFESTINEMLAK
ncbi:MAG: DsbA family protein [Candidatus Dojkabacteria bacterium]